jgi:hypothetical protein
MSNTSIAAPAGQAYRRRRHDARQAQIGTRGVDNTGETGLYKVS